MYDLLIAHVAGWKAFGLYDLPQVSQVGSVPDCSYVTSQTFLGWICAVQIPRNLSKQ